eukprot:SRR837773.13261.p1 GENE.SRR837773.13261~~SRR837773.13261.p1  ORF type:complete len:103 (+),score=9.16 SRR837773.13261:31-339(+)
MQWKPACSSDQCALAQLGHPLLLLKPHHAGPFLVTKHRRTASQLASGIHGGSERLKLSSEDHLVLREELHPELLVGLGNGPNTSSEAAEHARSDLRIAESNT